MARPPGEASPLLTAFPKEAAPLPTYLCFRERRGALTFTIALTLVAILCKEGGNTVLPTVLPGLQALSPEMLAVSALLPGVHVTSYAVGKASQILATYLMGGRLVICLALVLASCAQQLVSTGEPQLMLMGTALNAYANAHVWSACMRIIANWAAGNEMGRAIGWSVGLGQDLSIAVFSCIFAELQASISAVDEPHLHTFSPYILMSAVVLVCAAVMTLLLRSSAVAAGFEPPALPTRTADGSSSSSSSFACSRTWLSRRLSGASPAEPW